MTNLDASLADQLLSPRGARASEQPISQLMSEALANPDIISLAAGFVDNATLPTEILSESATRVLKDNESGKIALQYGTNAGASDLREEIAKRNFGEQRAELSDRMLLTAGSNQLLHLVSECLFAPGDIVLCAAPTYFVFLGLLKDMGVRPYGIEADAQGLTPEGLESALTAIEAQGDLSRVKAVYVIPYFDNPGGSTIPTERRRELLSIIERWKTKSSLCLLTDNAYRDLRYEGDDVPSFTELGADPETTIETGTFSKNFSPGIRIGWGVLPEWLLEPVLRVKSGIDFGSAHLNQRLMMDVIQSGGFDQQVERLRAAYRVKLDAILGACREHIHPIPDVEFRAPTGGLYVWIELPEGVSASTDSELWQECVARGVLYVPGEFCFPQEGARVKKNSIRLSFGVQEPDEIRKGIELLGNALNHVLASVSA